MFTITLKNCAFFAHHGVFAEEAVLGQRFYVDVEFDVDAERAAETDTLDGTVHYGIAFEVIEGIVTGARKQLIEALALAVARGLLDRFEEILRVRVTLRKPSAPIAGVLDYVQVSVEQSRV
ncbi:dihydroneopterin aldolase [Peteryoungia ipomoeae]|uniref:7,8-dihydroneopterin aldolase n=1 Tax=Peteryoungia ipomoeae TaxID=1210932 RepID=A0A4S8PC49_9HYPH|nr:dihydroneopterin aldolase [Peteryoungia ipomoeae]THV25844.1 dihydroneopterin aldolase [Peteryoungia ipomoeae]